MKILVTYQSKTGFTKQYANWIAEELSCDVKSIEEVKSAEVQAYDLVIHGGWLVAGMVKGLNKIRSFTPKNLIVFGVGMTKKDNADISQWIAANKLEGIPFFYYEGGMNPDKMGIFDKIIMKKVTKKKLEYQDYTCKADISEIIEKVNKSDL